MSSCSYDCRLHLTNATFPLEILIRVTGRILVHLLLRTFTLFSLI